VTNHCPFCGNYAYNVSVGDAYQMDCRYCEIQVEITKRAYAARCPDPVAVLDYIREKMKGSTRPRVDLSDMKRLRKPPEPSEEEKMAKSDSDALTTAAKAIGTTLGKIAVKTGMAHPAAAAATVPAKVSAKKKAPAARAATGTKGQSASKGSPKKPAPAAKNKTAPKAKQAK
jgi:hypothetical protein